MEQDLLRQADVADSKACRRPRGLKAEVSAGLVRILIS